MKIKNVETIKKNMIKNISDKNSNVINLKNACMK